MVGHVLLSRLREFLQNDGEKQLDQGKRTGRWCGQSSVCCSLRSLSETACLSLWPLRSR